MTNYDVVKKLIGEINPVGETYEDSVRYANLIAMTELVDKLIYDIDHVATVNKERIEFSRKQAGKFASKFLDDLGISE